MYKTLGKILCYFGALYIFLYFVSMLFDLRTDGSEAGYSTNDAFYSLYCNDWRMAVYGIEALRNEKKPQIFLLGPSVLASAFTPSVLVERNQNIRAHNLGMGFTNVYQSSELVADVFQKLDRGLWGKTCVVVGTHFWSMHDNSKFYSANNGISFYTMEKLRHGLYRKSSDSTINAIVPSKLMSLTISALKPVLLCYAAKYYAEVNFRSIRQQLVNRIVKNSNSEPVNYKNEYERVCSDDNDHSEQFKQLTLLIDEVRGRGASIVVVDLPIASHVLHLCSEYSRYKDALLQIVHEKNVGFIDMHDSLDDSEFSDGIHVKNRLKASIILRDRLSDIFQQGNFAQRI